MIIAVDSDLFISEITDLLFDAFILAAGPMLTIVPLNTLYASSATCYLLCCNNRQFKPMGESSVEKILNFRNSILKLGSMLTIYF